MIGPRYSDFTLTGKVPANFKIFTMASSGDAMGSVDLIKHFWPDLHFTNEDFGNPDSIVRFYSNFMAEINDKISYLLNEEIIKDEFDEIQDFGKEVILYCKVAKLLKKIKCLGSLHLADFYFSNPKKINPFVKFSIHFVIFMNNILDDVHNILDRNYKKLANIENLKVVKQELLRETAESAEQIARLEDSYESLRIQHEEVTKLHEKMMKEKIADEKNLAEKRTEVDVLQNEVDNLEYELKMLEDEEQSLNQCIVTDEEIESMKNTKKYLELEAERICNEMCTGDDTDIEKKKVKQMERLAKVLENVQLDSLDVKVLAELRQQDTQAENNLKKLNEVLSEINNTFNAEKQKSEELKKKLEKMESLNSELEKTVALEEEDLKKRYQAEVGKLSANATECQRLEEEISCVEKEIAKTESDERRFDETVVQEYKKILNADTKTTEKFYNMLQNFKNK